MNPADHPGRKRLRNLPIRLLLGILCVLVGGLTFGIHAHLVGAQSGNTKTAQQVFKNVQVLKDVPADNLAPAMQFVSASLGVECDFCHVRDAFEKDDKKTKQTARQMMQMMLAINRQNFQGEREVTCYTCHRGSSKPMGTPMLEGTVSHLAEARSSLDPGSAAAPDPALPSAKDILEKYVAAVGGASAIEKVSTRTEKGSVAFGAGPAVPIEILLKAPGKEVMTVHLPAGDSITAFDGQSGWLRAPGSPLREMHKADFEGARLDADLQFATRLEKLFSQFRVLKLERVGDREAILVLAANPKQAPLELYFDRESGLLLRQFRYSDSPLGLNPTRIDYADYKEVDGVKVPLHVTISRPNRRLDIRLDEVQQNRPIDDSKFEPT